eukprot:1182872-Prorocentrum_minimum.AAC.2
MFWGVERTLAVIGAGGPQIGCAYGENAVKIQPFPCKYGRNTAKLIYGKESVFAILAILESNKRYPPPPKKALRNGTVKSGMARGTFRLPGCPLVSRVRSPRRVGLDTDMRRP